MKILLIEDNIKLANNIREGLLHEGYMVECVHDGQEADKKVSTNHDDYDMIILDVMLPGKDGVALAQGWRRRNISTPILMLTAKGSTDEKVSGLNAGADDYLAKPFDFDELVARVRALLRRPKVSEPKRLELGQIVLDTLAHTVTCRGAEVDLTLKEFMVLEYMMRHRGEVVTRDALYAHAWDFADLAFSNTVNVHMKNLREKLKHDGETIQTIRGIGYKMAE
jgi:DNA-binding response OmpR family regulator